MKKRKHHYVWRHHLRAWGEGDQIWCKHENRVFRSNVENVAQERDFYKLRELSEDDLAFIREFAIESSPKGLREQHEYWIRLFTTVQAGKKLGNDIGITDPEFLKLIERFEHNLQEDLQGTIESAGMQCLDLMRKGDLSFYDDDELCITLMHYLSTQYFRTNTMKKRISFVFRENPAYSAKVDSTWNVMSHIFAANLGASLYRDRAILKPHIIENISSINLITSDQPLINAHKSAGGMSMAQPIHFDLYYPLGPHQAFVLCETSSIGNEGQQCLLEPAVAYYNARMANNAYSQLYGAAREDLTDYTAKGIDDANA